MPLVQYSRHSGKVYDIDLAAPPDERWTEAAERFGNQVHKLLAHVDEVLDESLSHLPAFWRHTIKLLKSRIATPLAGIVVRCFGQDYAHEIRGIGRTIGAPYGELVVANLLYDLSQSLTNKSACSSASFVTSKGKPVLARNLDWAFPDSVGEHSVVCRFHRRRSFYTSIGVAGFVGVLSAQRNKAWAVTLNQAPAHALPSQWTQMPACMHLRNSCDRSLTFNSLVRKIMSTQTMSPFFAHVVGTESYQQVVLNGYGVEYSQRETENGVLVQTNHFADPDDEHLNPTRAEFEEDGELFYHDTYPRYAALVRRLGKQNPGTPAAGLRLLNGLPVTNESTMQSMVLCPSVSAITLRVRPNPEWQADEWVCPWCKKDVQCFQGSGEYDCPHCDRPFEV